MDIVFTQRSGVNINNAPATLFVMATSIASENGYMIIKTNYEVASAMSTLREAGYEGVERPGSHRDIIYVDSPRRDPGIVVEALQAGPAIRDEMMRPVPGQDRVAEQAEQLERPAATLALTPGAPQEQVQPVAPPQQIAMPLMVTSPLNDEAIIKAALHSMTPGQASSASLYFAKAAEVNRSWGYFIQLRRQLDELTKAIDENEMVKKMSDDLVYLQTKCDIVESVAIATPEYKLSIITKEIITSDLGGAFGKKLVGKMQIVIDTRYLYCHAAPNQDFAKSFELRNLDRAMYSGGVYWMCGHVCRANAEAPQQVCLGGYSDQLCDAFIARDLPRVFDTLIRFIQVPNVNDSWGYNITLFPGVTNEAR